ncbi:hypothetical protein PYCCODRAFT_1434837 [Trametes coccinea BRFM310]|uniref:Uncharacterized protein n=1 Tax=Trametes coccinea (strain BRFM310) TaxID=1353009 RepID=A0A1Y2IQH8_TRAC3|nr:hypothetical protein PYCCODRAFT_1434837 [Trametes coccinea BRFM310]
MLPPPSSTSFVEQDRASQGWPHRCCPDDAPDRGLIQPTIIMNRPPDSRRSSLSAPALFRLFSRTLHLLRTEPLRATRLVRGWMHTFRFRVAWLEEPAAQRSERPASRCERRSHSTAAHERPPSDAKNSIVHPSRRSLAMIHVGPDQCACARPPTQTHTALLTCGCRISHR